MYNRIINKINRTIIQYKVVCLGQKYADYLTTGDYVFKGTENVIVNKASIDDSDIRVFGAKYKNRTNRRAFRVSQDGTKFDGSKLLLTSTGTLKIFSSKKSSVITIFKEAQRFDKYLENNKEAMKFFPAPSIYRSIRADKLIEEEYLHDDSTGEKKWELLIEFLFEMYTKKNIMVQNYATFPLEHRDGTIQKIFENYWLKHNNSKVVIPRFIQHGDMWNANILVCNNSIRIIDYDEMGEYVIFYDPMMYMFTEGFIGHCDSLLTQYLDGSLDKEISVMCNNFGLDFNDIGREQLFVAAFEEMIKIRFDDKGKSKVALDAIDHLRKVGFSF